MAKRRRRPGRPKARDVWLERERVFTEAVELLEAEGLRALTMRRLAERLGVTPMALYNHVSNKQELLTEVAAVLIAEADFGGSGSWRDRIRICFRELRRVLRAHPEVMRLLEVLEAPPNEVFRPFEITFEALREAGIDGDNAFRAFFLLVNFTIGQASYEVRGPFEGLDPRQRGGSANIKSKGVLKKAVWDFDKAFEFGLSVIIEGLKRVAVDKRRFPGSSAL
jgi:TetR/AcrR family tetracycline transcriptional repressor